MKKIIFILSLLCISDFSFSQADTAAARTAATPTSNPEITDKRMYRILKTDGGELIGQILSQNAREILILTKDHRQIYIPQHAIKEIKEIKESDFNAKGDFVGDDKFATRYVLTTNGLPILKGENYVQWNLFGPDFQFGIGKNLNAGIMTSWFGVPIIGSIKQSFQIDDNTQFALGALVGTGSWAALQVGGALPFATLSFGSRRSNIAFSGGYAWIWNEGASEGSFVTSVAGMTKIGPKISLVFDSFVLLPKETMDGFALLIPAVRWHQGEGKAFQFGFAGLIIDGDLVPFPIPMVQWYRSL